MVSQGQWDPSCLTYVYRGSDICFYIPTIVTILPFGMIPELNHHALRIATPDFAPSQLWEYHPQPQ